MHLAVLVWMVFKALKLVEIIKGVGVHRENYELNPEALQH